jgi:hypothetical protein
MKTPVTWIMKSNIEINAHASSHQSRCRRKNRRKVVVRSAITPPITDETLSGELDTVTHHRNQELTLELPHEARHLRSKEIVEATSAVALLIHLHD